MRCFTKPRVTARGVELGKAGLVSFVVAILLFSTAAAPSAGEVGKDWTRATANAGWTGRSGHASVVFKDKIWILGGYDGSMPVRNDVWHSADGVNWTQATTATGWSARQGHAALVFKNKIWVMGGLPGDVAGGEVNDVWNSEDGASWSKVADAGWRPRVGFGAVVFDDKIWVIGGEYGSYGYTLGDVWYSTDGVNWTQATANAGWGQRSGFGLVAFDGKMWMFGGWAGAWKNDVWYSADGVNWTQATAEAAWSIRYGEPSLVFDGKMWVIGSWAYGGRDVWYSTDGVGWTQATEEAGWGLRKGHSAVIFDNRMWIIGGFEYNSCSLKNDLWYSAPSEQVLQANVDIDPDTLNLKSKGKWITVYIELPEGYNIRDIDVDSILLNDTVWAESRPTKIGDRDGDGVTDLMVKFDRAAVQAMLKPGDVKLAVTGKVGALKFEGSDTIRVIESSRSRRPVGFAVRD
ncbi:MAG: kelch repeat-containing protein [Candidatus Hadarchaeota archaeon]